MIDISYDFRNDLKDPALDADKYSAILRNYHKILWSKTLPDGNRFNFSNIKSNKLYCKIDDIDYYFSSDSMIHTYSRGVYGKGNLIKSIQKEIVEAFLRYACTIGGYIIFPSNKINGLNTINQERGCSKYINDRFDLSLECIRCYYNNENSPLDKVLKRYNYFFKLFKSFKGYCEYFLLQDLVSDNYKTVKFFLPFKQFELNPGPNNINEYLFYKDTSIEFVINRNNRIKEYANRNYGFN